MYEPYIIYRSIHPHVILKKFPTPGELDYLRKYIVKYKDGHPYAKNFEIRKSVEIEFNKKFYKTKSSKPKPVNYALTRPT